MPKQRRVKPRRKALADRRLETLLEKDLAGTITARQIAQLNRLIQDLRKQARDNAKRIQGPSTKDWQSTVGMFAGDPVMKQIIEEGRRIREADRKKAKE